MRATEGGPRSATAAPGKASCCNKSHAFDFHSFSYTASDLVSLLSFTNWEDDFNIFYRLPSVVVASDSKGSLIFRVGLASGLWIWAVTVIHRDRQRERERESGRLDSVNECLQPTTALGVIISSVQNCHSVLFLSKRLFCVGTNKLLRVKSSCCCCWSRGARCPSWPFGFLMKTLLEFERFFTRKRGWGPGGVWLSQ
jgi:hypothetical protein